MAIAGRTASDAATARSTNCGTCHANVHGHPAKVANRQGRRQTETCLNCHDPHGTANLHLVRDLVHWRQRLYPVSFTVEAGLAPGGLASPSDPGSGMCEVCHRTDRLLSRERPR